MKSTWKSIFACSRDGSHYQNCHLYIECVNRLTHTDEHLHITLSLTVYRPN